MSLGSLLGVAKAPLYLPTIATRAKSLRGNPVLGSRRLNRWGLHRARVKFAVQMSELRRKQMRRLLSKEYRDALEEQGYVMIENFLPDELFQSLQQELSVATFPASEERLDAVAYRYITLAPKNLRQTPALMSILKDPMLQGLVRYAASSNRRPVIRIQTVFTDPDTGPPDDVTIMHSDTFHATAKSWLFLHDVEAPDGPFAYIPGSHRMNSHRLQWEFEQSVKAAADPSCINARGSFRVTNDDLASMGYGAPVDFTVPANTLVVADTQGFHARRQSQRSSVRTALYTALRSNPFSPSPGLDVFDLPGLRNRKGETLDHFRWTMARLQGKPSRLPYAGEFKVGDPVSV